MLKPSKLQAWHLLLFVQVALALKAKRAAEERAADIAYLQTAAAETRAVEEEEERVRSLLRAKAKDLQTVVRTQIKVGEVQPICWALSYISIVPDLSG